MAWLVILLLQPGRCWVCSQTWRQSLLVCSCLSCTNFINFGIRKYLCYGKTCLPHKSPKCSICFVVNPLAFYFCLDCCLGYDCSNLSECITLANRCLCVCAMPKDTMTATGLTVMCHYMFWVSRFISCYLAHSHVHQSTMSLKYITQPYRYILFLYCFIKQNLSIFFQIDKILFNK